MPVITLPDGSTVTLNHYSSLSYPEKFKSDKREVKQERISKIIVALKKILDEKE